MIKYSVLLVFVIVAWAKSLTAQTIEELIAKGNEAYERKGFNEAQQYYEDAISKDGAHQWPQAIYNLGNALYQQKKFEEARRQFESLQQPSVPVDLKTASWYNLGNSYLEQKNYAEAMAAYKEVLKMNPRDADARYNLSYVMNILGKQAPSKESTSQEQKPPDDIRIPPLTPEEQEKLMKEIASSELQTTKNLQKQVRQKSLKKDW